MFHPTVKCLSTEIIDELGGVVSTSMKSASVAGDFNAKSVEQGGCVTDARGSVLLEVMSSVGLS